MFGNNRTALLVFLLGLLLGAPVYAAQADESGLTSRDPGDWAPGPDSAPATTVGEHLLFPCPFPSGVDRHVWDVPVNRQTLAGFSGLELVYALEAPEAFRGLSWYARSGSGWYVASLPAGDGLRRVWLPWSSFEPEGPVRGWPEVDLFRLSPWSGGRGSGAVALYSVKARRARVAVLPPGERSCPDPGERSFGRRSAQNWMADFAMIGLPAALIEEAGFKAAALKGIDLLVLPYNPALPTDALRVVKDYVKGGGKLMICYNGQPDLAELAGVKLTGWTAGKAGHFHALDFSDLDGWAGPGKVMQPATPHVLPVYPRDKSGRVMAWWMDARGSRTDRPAVVASDRAVWFSYLLGEDDELARRQMLAFLADALLPGAALDAAHDRWAFLRLEAEHAGVGLDATVTEAALRSGKAGKAWAAVEAARAELTSAQTAVVEIPASFHLGIWDHTGKGLHGGDWNKTLDELAAAGFTDVFVYMDRGARMPPALTAEARRRALAVHAWHACFQPSNNPGEKPQPRQQGVDGVSMPWVCPSAPENRAAEQARVLELAATPGLTGLHLDYVRFPDAGHCYCRVCREAFEAAQGAPVRVWPDDVLAESGLRETFLDWRAGQISSWVRDVSEAVRASFPALMLSAAVWPDLRTVKPQLGQDWPQWLAAGWLDAVMPMSYTENTGEFAAWTASHSGLPNGSGKIWAGLGVTSAHTRLTPPSVLRQIRAAVDSGAAGAVLFDLNTTVRETIFPVTGMLKRNGKP